MRKIKRPTFIVIEDVVKNNIDKLLQKSIQNEIIFRPHFKTHQSGFIGDWFKEKRIERITVSSVTMAKYFADQGWKDILVAFPVNINELNEINTLAAKIKLHLLVENTLPVSILQKELKSNVKIWLKIDAGYGRAGVLPENKNEIFQIIKNILKSPTLEFEGILSHYGNTYSASGKEEIISIYNESTHKLMDVKKFIVEHFGIDCKISIGDTPSVSVVENFRGVDEIRPGNFVFYDLMQYQLGVCSENDLGCCVACPVISLYPHRKQALIYGGAVHFSKEFLIENSGEKVFGYSSFFDAKGRMKLNKKIKLTGLSQEHGIVAFEDGIPENIKIGDTLFFIPVHSCLTANLFSSYLNIRFEIIEKMK